MVPREYNAIELRAKWITFSSYHNSTLLHRSLVTSQRGQSMEEGTKSKRTVYVGGLNEEIDETFLYETFATFGASHVLDIAEYISQSAGQATSSKSYFQVLRTQTSANHKLVCQFAEIHCILD